MHNQLAEDVQNFWDKCPLIELCDYNIPEDEDEPEKPKPSPPNCERFAWAGKVELIMNTCKLKS